MTTLTPREQILEWLCGALGWAIVRWEVGLKYLIQWQKERMDCTEYLCRQYPVRHHHCSPSSQLCRCSKLHRYATVQAQLQLRLRAKLILRTWSIHPTPHEPKKSYVLLANTYTRVSWQPVNDLEEFLAEIFRSMLSVAEKKTETDEWAHCWLSGCTDNCKWIHQGNTINGYAGWHSIMTICRDCKMAETLE